MTRMRTFALAPLLALLGLAPPGGGGPTGPAAPAGAYVALGDSYTAGPLIPVQLPEQAGCLRSDRNYPRLVAGTFGFKTFRDASCSGAGTTDMTSPQAVPGGINPPQLDSLDQNTTVVTLQIGGNDIGFYEIATSCISPVPLGTPCRDQYAPEGVDQLAGRIAQTGPRVGAVIDEIRRRSPDARVFVLGYPPIFPEAYDGCWPVMPFTAGDTVYLREVEKQLNAMLTSEAAGHSATYVDVFTPGIGKDACVLLAKRWIEPVVPLSPAAPVHPNAAGMAGIAAVVSAAIQAGQ